MSGQVQSISIKGKQRDFPAVPIGPKAIVVIKGTFLKIAEVQDEYWLESKDIPEPSAIIDKLHQVAVKPDLFTFTQKIPDISPKYSYHLEWNNLAVAKFESYDEWFERIVDRSVRKHIRKSVKEGLQTELVSFTDAFVKGIVSIYNELPVRQGRKFWHYGKSFDEVKQDNATYLDRSIFIGSYFENELVGFLKFVTDGEVANIMQILSKSAYFSKRPTNALIAKAVEVCASRKIKYLIYGEHTYGKKDESSLIDFKENNGFRKMELPRYYVPMTAKGHIALKFGIHKGLANLLPRKVTNTLIFLRSKILNMPH
jgi:hypothetical protein